MKQLYFILGMSTFVLSCGTTRNYDYKSKPKIIAEKTSLAINDNTEKIQNIGVPTIVATLAPSIIDLGIQAINQNLKTDATKYTATYKASNSSQNFYRGDNEVELPWLTIERKIITHKNPKASTDAVFFTLIPEISDDKTAFRYKLDKENFKYLYSIAKLKGKYDYLDIYIEIKIKNITIVSNVYTLNEIRTVNMLIPTVKVGDNEPISDQIYSGWIPLFPKSSIDQEIKEDVVEHKITEKINEKKVITKTEEIVTNKDVSKFKKEHFYPSGVYEIDVTVSEVNIAKLGAERRADLFDATSETGSAVLKSILELITPNAEEEKNKVREN